MHYFLNDLDKLFALAQRAEPAPPLDSAAVMRQIGRAAAVAAAEPLQFAPSRPDSRTFYFGIGSVAAILALVVAVYAASAWASLNDPLLHLERLPDIASFLLLK